MEPGDRLGSKIHRPRPSVDIVVHGADEMRALGVACGLAARAGDRFFLTGPFGAGKTTFVQGLARGLGVAEPVGSPSFVLETRYQGRLGLAHVDLYRLEGIESGLLAELEELLFSDLVTAVEWPEKLPGGLRDGATELSLTVTGAEERRVTIDTGSESIRSAVEPFHR